MTVSASAIVSNTAEIGGGLRAGGNATVSASTIASNTAGLDGGGLYVSDAASVDGSAIVSNTAEIGGGLLAGGAAMVSASPFAYAQSMPGQALFNYATPILLFMIVASVLIALGTSLFNREAAKWAVGFAIVGVVMFFIMKTASSLAAAVQN